MPPTISLSRQANVALPIISPPGPVLLLYNKMRMQFLVALLVATFALHGPAVVCSDSSGRYGYERETPRQRSSTSSAPIECMLVQVHAMYPNGHPSQGHADVEEDNGGWRCVDESQQVYSLEDLPVDFIQSNHLEPRDSAHAYLTISSATKIQQPIRAAPIHAANRLFARSSEIADSHATTNTTTAAAIVQDRIKVDPGAVVSVSRAPHNDDSPLSLKHRRLANAGAGNPTGGHSLLVVRVTDKNGKGPSKTSAQLAADIFSDANNLRSQYLACSGKKLVFQPATGSGIVNGVMELKLKSQAVNRVASSTVENWVNGQLDSMGLGSKYTHTLLVLPGNVDFGGAAAYAYVGWGKSVFWDGYAATLLVLVHELGHNLKQLHSGDRATNSTYGDYTCMMGAHVYQDDAPKMCFNGAKSWYLGWYSNRHVTINPASNYYHGKLVGVNDYVRNLTVKDKHHVVAKIGNLFLIYNRKEGINSEVASDGDKVTVVEQKGEQQQSWKLAALDNKQVYRKTNFSGSRALVVQVCEKAKGSPDYARVLVYLEGSGSNPTCSSALTTNDSGSFDCKQFHKKGKKCRKYPNQCRWNKKRRKCWNK